MSKLNVAGAVTTHENGVAQKVNPFLELKRSVMTCMLWEPTFYEKGSEHADRIIALCHKVSPEQLSQIAIEAREKMYLRHVPLLLIRELARIKGWGKLVAATLYIVIQRPDELTEFLAIYWRQGREKVSVGVKKGLAKAFTKFNEYSLAKYNKLDAPIKLRDVLFICHAKPKDDDQAKLWKRLINNKLEVPETWEVLLSADCNKRIAFERLLIDGKLGGLALLRNLRNMQEAGVNDGIIRNALLESNGMNKVLPFRFVTAARYAPQLEDAIETAMFRNKPSTMLRGHTLLVVDVSSSMNQPLSANSETTRMDAAAGLAILLREKCERFGCVTFSKRLEIVPPRRGFALRDAIITSQGHLNTYMAAALTQIKKSATTDRVIVITDEQSQDGNIAAWIPKSYLINVASYANGVSYGMGWTHIDGWSDRVLDYIETYEEETKE